MPSFSGMEYNGIISVYVEIARTVG